MTLSEAAGSVSATVRGVAKEGLIRQRAGEKAAVRVAERLTAIEPDHLPARSPSASEA